MKRLFTYILIFISFSLFSQSKVLTNSTPKVLTNAAGKVMMTGYNPAVRTDLLGWWNTGNVTLNVLLPLTYESAATDLSGLGKTLSQATTSLQPYHLYSEVNGYAGGSYANQSRFLRRTDTWLAAKAKISVYVVGKFDAAGFIVAVPYPSTADVKWVSFSAGGGGLLYYEFITPGTNYCRYALPLPTGYHIYTMIYDGTQATNILKVQCYFDGVAKTLTFGGTIPTTLSWMGMFGLGNQNNAGYAYWTEVILADGVDAQAMRWNMENYLSFKYNIAVTH
jgi:hypothetical protein